MGTIYCVNKHTARIAPYEYTKLTKEFVTIKGTYGGETWYENRIKRISDHQKFFLSLEEAAEYSRERVAQLQDWIDRAKASLVALNAPAAKAAACGTCGHELVGGKCQFINHNK